MPDFGTSNLGGTRDKTMAKEFFHIFVCVYLLNNYYTQGPGTPSTKKKFIKGALS